MEDKELEESQNLLNEDNLANPRNEGNENEENPANHRSEENLRNQENLADHRHMCIQTRWRVGFIIIASIVEIALLVKLPLYGLKQVSPRIFLAQSCPQKVAFNESVSHGYIFTTTVYSCLYITRWLESLILHIQLYKFFFHQREARMTFKEFKDLSLKGLQGRKRIISLTLFLLYLTVHSLSVPAMGIYIEISQGKATACETYIYQYHVVYWIFDIIRYLHDVLVRVLFILATAATHQIWSTDSIDKAIEDFEDNNRPQTLDEYLQDEKATCDDHKERLTQYEDKGNEVKAILNLFKPWFLIPWISLAISISLDTEEVLRSWKDIGLDDVKYEFSEIVYMVYSANQLVLLATAYVCAKIMNTQHDLYHDESRLAQLQKYKLTASRMGFACQNKIVKNDAYNFTPRFWCTRLKVSLDNPLYVLVLLVGYFFTVINSLI